MLKFKLYYDKDEEEIWLNEMCLKGWAFKKFFLGFYTFEKCKPGEYNYQIDILDNWNGEKKDYADFMEATEVKIVGQWWRWVYLEKKASEGPFEMYTDLESKIIQYTKIKNFFKILFFMELFIFFFELINLFIASPSFIYVPLVCTILIGFICLAMIRIVLKCNKKIKELKKQKDM